MSRQYDAKHEALAAYPDNRPKGVELFLMALNVSAEDFAYEEGMSAEEYIYVNRSFGPIPNEQDRSVEDIEGFEL